MEDKKLHRVLIVGGGAGGLELATKLGDSLGKKKKAEITLIDAKKTHIWKPLLHEIAAGSINPDKDELDYLAQGFWHGFKFRLGRMDKLDREKKEVSLEPYFDNEGNEIIYVGPDRYRGHNLIEVDQQLTSIKASYDLDDHYLTFGYETDESSVYNSFINRYNGEINFRSLDDFYANTHSRVETFAVATDYGGPFSLVRDDPTLPAARFDVEEKIMFIAFCCLQLQGTLYNYYYVIFRNKFNGDKTSRIIEDHSPTAMPGEKQGNVDKLFWVYNFFYSLFDKAIYQMDKNAEDGHYFPKWFMTAVSSFGLGFQLLIISFMLCLGLGEFIIPFFISYSFLIIVFILLRKGINSGRIGNYVE